MSEDYANRERVLALGYLVEQLLLMQFRAAANPLAAAEAFKSNADELHSAMAMQALQNKNDEMFGIINGRAVEIEMILEGVVDALKDDEAG